MNAVPRAGRRACGADIRDQGRNVGVNRSEPGMPMPSEPVQRPSSARFVSPRQQPGVMMPSAVCAGQSWPPAGSILYGYGPDVPAGSHATAIIADCSRSTLLS
jgi:hypothetical protein